MTKPKLDIVEYQPEHNDHKNVILMAHLKYINQLHEYMTEEVKELSIYHPVLEKEAVM